MQRTSRWTRSFSSPGHLICAEAAGRESVPLRGSVRTLGVKTGPWDRRTLAVAGERGRFASRTPAGEDWARGLWHVMTRIGARLDRREDAREDRARVPPTGDAAAPG